jgi:hypothetical protein
LLKVLKCSGIKVPEAASLVLLLEVKVKVNGKFTLELATKAQRGSRGIALLTSVLDGAGWSTPRPGRFTPGKDPLPIV